MNFNLKALSPFPQLETTRLILRACLATDAQLIMDLRSDPRVLSYMDTAAFTSIDQAQKFVDQKIEDWKNAKGISWVITLKADKSAIGDITYWRIMAKDHRAEIGYSLKPEYWQKGYMTEALTTILQWGFQTLGLHSVLADINPHNSASRNLLQKVGFEKEGYLKENYYFNGQYLDSEIYGLTEKKFIK